MWWNLWSGFNDHSVFYLDQERQLTSTKNRQYQIAPDYLKGDEHVLKETFRFVEFYQCTWHILFGKLVHTLSIIVDA